ncbi:MAG: M20/M25/M40 family metallo-hydrolase [Thermoanaerobaculia bacterium]|nr:M20/M25/M40 family metallo-hydrolase [Thermoanaerobaculia bacterium]
MTTPDRPPLERAARHSARVALWASLVATALAALLLHRFATPIPDASWREASRDQELWLAVDFATRPEVELLRELVSVDTSAPPAGESSREAELADRIAARLAHAGVPATVERFADGRANLWAFVEGADPRAVVLHGHLDVEPPLEEGAWRFPPFSGAIDGPWIYGRGMYDMKSLLAAQLLAFEAVAAEARAGRLPARSLMLLFTSSEESGSDTGTRWILAEHPELVARLATVLTEGGVIEALGPREVKYFGVEFAQKRFAFFELCAADRESLASLRAELLTRGASDARPRVSPEVATFLASYGPSRGREDYRVLLRDPERLVREDDRFRQLTPFLQSLFNEAVYAFEPQPAEGGGWTMKTVAHLLPGSSLEALLADRLPPWLTHGVTVGPALLAGADHGSPVDHPDFRALTGVVARRHPEAAVGPYFLPVTATDARHFRAAGRITYGFSPFVLMPAETTGIGKPDEKMQLPAFLAGTALYREVVETLVAAPARTGD